MDTNASLEELVKSCRTNAQRTVPNLNRCANLAPAGTASDALVVALYQVAPRTAREDVLYRFPLAKRDLASLQASRLKLSAASGLRNSSTASSRGQNTMASRWTHGVIDASQTGLIASLPYVIHRHYRRASGFAPLWHASANGTRASAGRRIDEQQLPKHHGAPSCLIMTVREPSERFLSGFRASFGNIAVRRRQYAGHTTAAGFIRALREHEPRATRIFNISVSHPTYAFSNGGACCDEVAGGGSNFLTAQVDYLRGLSVESCQVLPLYFVCTESLDADVDRLHARALAGGRHVAKGRRSGASTSPSHARHARFEETARGKSGVREQFLNSTALSPADRSFLRERLYPMDARLHELVCGGGIRGDSQHNPDSV